MKRTESLSRTVSVGKASTSSRAAEKLIPAPASPTRDELVESPIMGSNIASFFSLESVDFGNRDAVAAEKPIEEEHLIMEAIQLAQSRHFDGARDIAEAVLTANPSNSTALQVNASECESRQEWGEAARFFLVGMGHNNNDSSFEHGFQTNMDLLRTARPRWLERGDANKWKNVLTFKPRVVERAGGSEEKLPWARLGIKYEEVLYSPGYVNDVLQLQSDVEEARMELRRIFYENMEFLDILYGYYKADMNEDWEYTRPIPGMVKHTGSEPEDREPLRLRGLWRILKECKIAMGDVRAKAPVAVYNRIFHMSKLRIETAQKKEKSYTPAEEDPHKADAPVDFYVLVETLVRIAQLRLQGSLSHKVETLIKDMLKPLAMRKQTDRSFLDYRSGPAREVWAEEAVQRSSRKIFEFFIASYRSGKKKGEGTLGPLDLTMSLNHLLVMVEKMELFDPTFNVKKCVETFSKLTCDSDLLPQEHPNNANSEMIYDEFCDLVTRMARLKAVAKTSTRDALKELLAEMFSIAKKTMPGKF